MCGFLLTRDNKIDSSKFNISFNLLKYRGPDGSKIIQSGEYFFGFHRLSIIDENTRSMQPFDFGKYLLLYNGELYNYKELRNKLIGIDGNQFITNSDTEVFMKYLIKYGINAHRDFKGMYSYVLFNKEKKTIKFGRDGFGIKPLYYYHSDKSLIISSSLKSIKSITESQTDQFNLITFNKYGFTYGDRTIYKNIFECRPGTEIEIDISLKKINFTSFFNLKSFFFDRNIKEFDKNYLYENTKLHLESDVKTCILKSDGIDSNLISFYKFEIDKEINSLKFNLNDMSFIFNNDYKNEYIKINDDDYNEAFNEYLDLLEYPTIDGFNTYLITKIAKKKNFKVCLSGLGLDELFDGYGINNKIKFLKKYKITNKLLKFIHNLNNIKIDKLIFNNKRLDILDYYLQIRKISTTKNLNYYFSTKEINDNYDELKENISLNTNQITNKVFNQYELVRIFEFEFYLKNQLLKDSDYFSMINSVELRVPFVERNLIQNLILENSKNLTKRNFFYKNYFEIMKKLNIENTKNGFIVHDFKKLGKYNNYKKIIKSINNKFN